jgi:hypothetical protein
MAYLSPNFFIIHRKGAEAAKKRFFSCAVERTANENFSATSWQNNKQAHFLLGQDIHFWMKNIRPSRFFCPYGQMV